MSVARHLIVVLAAVLASGHAFAQWQWVDASGRKVFSDTAPPPNIPEKNVLKRPGGASASAPTPEPVAPAAAASSIKPPVVDAKLEAKRKEAENEEAAKRKAEEEKVAAARAENCIRAKNAKATLALGTRVQTVNAKGERDYMDDAARARENQRLDGIIAIDCANKPANKPVSTDSP